MKPVFADTFYFLALLNRADEVHGPCAAFAREYRGQVLTSAYVLVKLADGLAKPQYRVQTVQFIRARQNRPQVRIVPASEALLQRGIRQPLRQSVVTHRLHFFPHNGGRTRAGGAHWR